jgi:hypothetical protein
MAAIKSELIALRGNLYYYKVDPDAKTISFYSATNKTFQNDTGSLIFTEKISSLKSTSSSGSSSTITNANDTLIKSFGRNALSGFTKTALYRIENSSDPAISQALGITQPGNQEQIEEASGGNALPPVEPTPAAPAPTASQIQQQRQAALDDVTIGENQRRAAALEIKTASLPVIARTLTYPIGLDRNIQDTLQIDVFKYEPARGLPGINTSTDSGRFLRTGIGKKKKPITMITIPIPNAVGDSNAVSWGGGQFSSVAGTLGNEINNAIFGTLQQTGTGPLDDFTKISNAVGGAAAGAIRAGAELISNPYVQRKVLLENLAKAAGAFGINVDVTQVITRTGGVVENPNLELLFTGPSLRSFQFTVSFTPRSKEESIIVRKIIRVLKQHSAVKKGATLGTQSRGFNNTNLLLGTPDVFTLKYMKASKTNEEIKGLTKMKTCALTNLSVDYTGEAGRWAAYDGDSQPVTTLVTMNFAELAPIYDVDYRDNFGGVDSLDDVGF